MVSRKQKAKSGATAPRPPAPPDSRAVGERHQFWLGAAALIVIGFVSFLPAVWAGFVWDDELVHSNPLLESANGLWRIWTDPYSSAEKDPRYWPILYTSFWIEHQLWGAAPMGYHIVNLALHALNGVLVWILLRRLGVPGAWLAAAIFLAHPTRAEVAAWVIERKGLLSSTFYLLSCLAFLRFFDTRKRGIHAVSLLLFVCAILTKPTTVTLPAALALWVWWKRDEPELRDWAALIPFFTVSAGAAAFTVWFAGEFSLALPGLSPLERFLVSGRAIWFYAEKIVWPFHLMAIYPRWPIDTASAAPYLFPAAAFLAALGLWIARGSIGKAPLVALLYFILTLAPVLGVVEFSFMIESYVADRFLYLPGIAPIALICAAVAIGARRWGEASRQGVWALCAILIVGLGSLSWRQAALYHSLLTLFGHCVESNPESATAHNNYGYGLRDAGRLDEAIEHFARAAELRPGYATALNNLGAAYGKLGHFDEAIQHLEQAIEVRANYAEAHNNLANALCGKGRFEEASMHLQEALRIDPDYESARKNLALVEDMMRNAALPLAGPPL